MLQELTQSQWWIWWGIHNSHVDMTWMALLQNFKRFFETKNMGWICVASPVLLRKCSEWALLLVGEMNLLLVTYLYTDASFTIWRDILIPHVLNMSRCNYEQSERLQDRQRECSFFKAYKFSHKVHRPLWFFFDSIIIRIHKHKNVGTPCEWVCMESFFLFF